MAIGSVLQTGISGIQRGIRGAADAADKIAKTGIQSTDGLGTNDNATTANATTDLADAAVNLKQNELLVKASARVVKAADDMLGSILDITA